MLVLLSFQTLPLLKFFKKIQKLAVLLILVFPEISLSSPKDGQLVFLDGVTISKHPDNLIGLEAELRAFLQKYPDMFSSLATRYKSLSRTKSPGTIPKITGETKNKLAAAAFLQKTDLSPLDAPKNRGSAAVGKNSASASTQTDPKPAKPTKPANSSPSPLGEAVNAVSRLLGLGSKKGGEIN